MIRAAILPNPHRRSEWVDMVLDVGEAFYDETSLWEGVGYLDAFNGVSDDEHYYLYRDTDRLLVRLGDGQTCVANRRNLTFYMERHSQPTDSPMALVDILDGVPIT